MFICYNIWNWKFALISSLALSRSSFFTEIPDSTSLTLELVEKINVGYFKAFPIVQYPVFPRPAKFPTVSKGSTINREPVSAVEVQLPAAPVEKKHVTIPSLDIE